MENGMYVKLLHITFKGIGNFSCGFHRMIVFSFAIIVENVNNFIYLPICPLINKFRFCAFMEYVS